MFYVPHLQTLDKLYIAKKNIMSKANLLLLFFSLTFISYSCKKSEKKEDEKESVILLKKVNYNYKSPRFNTLGSHLFHYDANGKLMEVEFHSSEEDLQNHTKSEGESKVALEYDANGKLQKSIVTINNKPAYSYNYHYNSAGHIIKKVQTSQDPRYSISDHVYVYDNQGRLVADTTLGLPVGVIFYYTYSYDAAGNAVTYGAGSRSMMGTIQPESIEGHAKYDNKRNPYSLLDPNYHVLFNLETINLFNRNNPIETQRMGIYVVDQYQNVYLPNGLLKEYTRQVALEDMVIKESFEYEEIK